MDGQDERGGANKAADKKSAGGGAGRHWAWAGAVAVLGLCVLAGFVINQCSPANQAKGLADASAAAGNALFKGTEKLVEAIKKDYVTQTFSEHLDSIKPGLEGRLLVAEVKATEEFSSADANWLGTTTADIRVPVTFNYYVALSDPWQLKVNVTSKGVMAEVLAPALKPLPDPSPDTAKMEINSANGWARWDKDVVQTNLLKEMTPSLNARAAKKLPQYFPVARPAVEKFVKDWILQQYGVPENTPVFIQVKFRNEPGAPAQLDAATPASMPDSARK